MDTVKIIKTALKTLSIVVIMFVLNSPVYPAGEKAAYDGWAWTRKKLNPTWMECRDTYWPTKPKRGGYLSTASAAYIGLMNPNHWPVNDWASISLFYEGITAYNGKYSQRVVWLMESFEFLSPTTLIMKLKQGVKFHDGTDFNAESLKYLFDWIGDKKNGCWTRGQQERIKSLEVIDEYTLKWTTKKPWGSFPQGFFAFQISAKALKGDIALRELKAVEKKLETTGKKLKKAEKKYTKASGKGGEDEKKALRKLEKAKKALSKIEKLEKAATEKARGHISTDLHPVGTGPFMLEEASPGNFLKLKRNPNWWFGRSIGRPEMPYFDGIKVTVIPDPTIRLANFRAGKIDTLGLSKAQYHMLKKDPGIRIHTFPNNSTSLLLFNQTEGPCADIRVRKAISHAIDRKALVAGTQFGQARIASCLFPDDHWAHNPDIKPLKYDPELSKKLLTEAGYGKGLTLSGVNYNYADAKTLGTAIKGMLTEAGINWKIDVLDSVAVNDRMKNLEYDMAISAQPYIQDPDANLTFIYHSQGGFHHSRNNNKRLISLIEEGRYEVDEKKRQQIYYRIEKELHDSCMDIYLFWDIASVAFRKNVQGWNNDMYIRDRTLYTQSHPQWFKDGRP